MKQYQPRQFLEAAKLLANGNDPDRLAEALASWARFVGFPHRADDDQDDRDMLLAARILEEKLPYYVQDHLGLPTRDYVDAVLTALPELIEFLQAQVRPPQKGGRPPDSRRRLCAAVCAEAWHHYHGKIEPFSPKLQAACEAYWQCCDHPETSKTGRLKNWEEFLRWAKRESDEEFRENFLQQLNDHLVTTPK